MPNWKKLIVSGSDASLNSLTVNGNVSTTGNITSTADNVYSLGSATNRFQLNGGTPVTVTGTGTQNYITRFVGSTQVQNSKIFSSDTLTSIQHSNNGNSIFQVSGSNGQILNIADESGDEIFRVNSDSGLEIFTVSGSGELKAPNLPYESTSFVLSYASGSGNIRFVSASAVAFDYNSLSNVPSGIISGSAQISAATFYKTAVNGALSYSISHSLGELYPIVQVYDGNGYQIVPKDILSVNTNQVRVTFSDEFSGTVVVKK